MDTRASDLHAYVAAVAPITGVSVGDWNDRQTWRVAFAPEATPGQRTVAASRVASFDPAPSLSPTDDQRIDRMLAGHGLTIGKFRARLARPNGT